MQYMNFFRVGLSYGAALGGIVWLVSYMIGKGVAFVKDVGR
jgi:hypothetical protein